MWVINSYIYAILMFWSAGAMPREFTDTTLPPQKRRILRLMCFWLWSRSLSKACGGMLFIWLDLTWAHFSWPSDLRCDLQDLQMVTTEVWLENKLPGLPKNTGVIVHCPQVLWKTLTRPNYYNITVIYINTCFRAERAEICASVTGACYKSHTASQVAAFGCSLSYKIFFLFSSRTLPVKINK